MSSENNRIIILDLIFWEIAINYFVNINYFKTGYFEFIVTAPGRDAFTHKFTGRILGSALNTIGTIPFETGNFKKLILADAKSLKLEVVSNSYLPLALTGADWEGNYVVRTVSRR